MWLESLALGQVRNVSHASLEGCTALNLLVGPNGSGKTSVLEAIHILSTGRSFRTPQWRHLIQRGQDQLWVTGQCGPHRLGLSKNLHQDPVVRLDGQSGRQSELTRILPVMVFEPDSTGLLEQGSQPRRQMLDWLLFHVEPKFYPLWRQYQRVLQQRNAALKQPGAVGQLAVWDQQLVHLGEQIHGLREHHLGLWQTVFQPVMASLLPGLAVTLGYQPGFDPALGLAADLQRHRASDLERGYTGVGIHRASLSLKTPLGLAEHVWSRGQKKLLVLGLKLSQLSLMDQQQQRCVVLLDDLEAELDAQALSRIWQVLTAIQSQIFMTALGADRLLSSLDWPSTPTVLHLKQGVLSR